MRAKSEACLGRSNTRLKLGERGLALQPRRQDAGDPSGWGSQRRSSRFFAFEKSTFVRQFVYTVKAKKIRLFVKPYCGWCDKAERWLDQHEIDYETVDVMADENAYDEMIQLSGQELAPVIDVDGKILADFGPEQLAAFWRRLEKDDARLEAR